MSKVVKLSGGKYGLKESLISIKKKEIEKYTKILSEREQGIETQSSQIAEIAESTSAKVAQLEREYSIRIRNIERDCEQNTRELEAAKADLEVAKVELEKCTLLMVSKRKTLTENVADLETKVAKLTKKAQTNEDTLKQMQERKEKELARYGGKADEVPNTIEEDKKNAEVLRESIEEKQQDLKAIEAMTDEEIIKLYADDSVLREYVYYIICEEKDGASYIDINGKNCIFAAFSPRKLKAIIDELIALKKIDKVPNSVPTVFKSLEA